jgi:cytidylate kinase
MSVVITVSRQLGSQGSYIAAEVADKLGLRYIDREILNRAAEKAGYPDEKMVAMLEKKERVPGLLEKIVASLNTMPMVPTMPSATMRESSTYQREMVAMITQEFLNQERRQAASEAYGELIQMVIQEYAHTGAVVIAGRGGQIVLKNYPDVLHIQIQAPVEVRIKNLMERTGVDYDEAEQQVIHSDRQRARYMKHFYNVVWDDPALYHFVINTGKISRDMAVHLVSEAATWLAK